MNEARREAMLAELTDAQKERDQLNIYIETLAGRLGVKTETGGIEESANGGGSVPPGGGLADDALAEVYENELHGMSMTKAAEAVLRRWSPPPYRRPLKTTELLAALRKGGLEIKTPRNLYRALYPSAKFHNLKGGQWGLAEWYPPSVRAKGDRGATAEDSEADASSLDEPTDLLSDTAEGRNPLAEVHSP